MPPLIKTVQVVKPTPICQLHPKERNLLNSLKPLIRASQGPEWHFKARERQTTGSFDALKEAGFDYIGEGMFRKAFLFRGDKCVLKTAKGLEGMEHMRTENETWRTAPPDLRPWLVPVDDEDPDGAWNTMPAVERYLTRGKQTMEERLKASRTQALLNQVLERKDWFCDDLHLGNIGRYRNLPVALDYGFGCERLSERRKKMVDVDDFDWGPGWEPEQKLFEGKGPEQVTLPSGVRVTFGGSGEPPKDWAEKARRKWFRQRQPRRRSQWF